jgi:hypothetical protein
LKIYSVEFNPGKGKCTLIGDYLNLVKISNHLPIIIIFAPMTIELLKDLRDRLMVLRRFL